MAGLLDHCCVLFLFATRTSNLHCTPAPPCAAPQITIQSSSLEVLDMYADNPGTWLFHCHLNEHMDGGMMSLFTVQGDAPKEALNGKVGGRACDFERARVGDAFAHARAHVGTSSAERSPATSRRRAPVRTRHRLCPTTVVSTLPISADTHLPHRRRH